MIIKASVDAKNVLVKHNLCRTQTVFQHLSFALAGGTVIEIRFSRPWASVPLCKKEFWFFLCIFPEQSYLMVLYPDVQRVIKMFAHNDENHIYEMCNIKVSRQYSNPSLIKIKILSDRLGMASG